MNYITQIEAVDLCRQLRIEFSTDDIVEDNQIKSVHELCNAAIQHYIETSMSELTGTAYTVPALVQPAKPVEFQGYAGVSMWLGKHRITQVLTEAEIQHELEEGASLTRKVQYCLDSLAAAKERT
jgi:hypothetical protein